MLMEFRNANREAIHEIEYTDETDLVEAVCYSAASEQELKQALLCGLIVHEQTRCAYRLDDITKLSSLWADWVDWLEEVWQPCAYRAGLRYVAYVVNLNSFAEVTNSACSPDNLNALIEKCFFTDRESALNWLKTKSTGAL